MKTLLILFICVMALIFSASPSYGFEHASRASAKLASEIKVKEADYRAELLEGYLRQYNSPLASSAKTFVEAADKYQLDWRLVAAISGLESYFGQRIPYNSYNAWGWGVYGTNVIRFKSWDEGIVTISKGLRERYLKDRVESDPYVIGPTYAASPTWAQRVSFFINRIEDYRVKNAKNSLALAL